MALKLVTIEGVPEHWQIARQIRALEVDGYCDVQKELTRLHRKHWQDFKSLMAVIRALGEGTQLRSEVTMAINKKPKPNQNGSDYGTYSNTTSKTLDRTPSFVAEYLRIVFVEEVLRVMEEENLTKSVLAKRMGKTRQYVTRVLNENANFTIERLAEFACALDRKLSIRLHKTWEHVETVPTKLRRKAGSGD